METHRMPETLTFDYCRDAIGETRHTGLHNGAISQLYQIVRYEGTTGIGRAIHSTTVVHEDNTRSDAWHYRDGSPALPLVGYYR